VLGVVGVAALASMFTPPTRGSAGGLTITEGAVEKYSARLFAKLGLLPDETGHRRVRAVLARLQRG
jgi:hypothetical protein